MNDDQTIAAGVLCLVMVALLFIYPGNFWFMLLAGLSFLWLNVRLFKPASEKV